MKRGQPTEPYAVQLTLAPTTNEPFEAARMLTYAEAAALLKVDKRTVRRRVADGRYTAYGEGHYSPRTTAVKRRRDRAFCPILSPKIAVWRGQQRTRADVQTVRDTVRTVRDTVREMAHSRPEVRQ